VIKTEEQGSGEDNRELHQENFYGPKNMGLKGSLLWKETVQICLTSVSESLIFRHAKRARNLTKTSHVHLGCNLFLVNREPRNAIDNHKIMVESSACDWTETAVNAL
jgi:hypothetical protein